MFKFIALAKRSTRSLTVTAVVSASALVLAATPAVAASQSQVSVPSYHCHLFASEPKLSTDGHEITGLGTSTCTGTGWQDQKLVVTLEAQILPMLYVVVAQVSTDYSSSRSLQQTVSWPCTFSGTGTYTIETSWYGENGAVYSYKYPGKSLNLTCTS
jgi:hypothetical protein